VGKLFILFTALPLLDLWLLLRIGRAIGFWPAVGLVVATGFIGAWLARAEGFRVLRSWQASLSAGRLPEDGVLSGVLVLVGAALLVAPGVITDAIGLALLFPPTRRLAAAGLRRRIARRVQAGRVRVVTFGGPSAPREPDDDYIDVTPPPRDRRA
jgi:UPF0716 protein FxsA